MREVTAFPLSQRAEELLLGAPGRVGERQLKELHIQLSLAARERLRRGGRRRARGERDGGRLTPGRAAFSSAWR